MITKTYAAATSLDSQYGFATNQFSTISGLINNFMTPLISILAVIVVFSFLYSAFQYITSAGDKETVGKARKRMTYAIIGLVLLLLVFLVAQFLPQFLGLNQYQITR